MTKVYVCETCGSDLDESGYIRYRFRKTADELDQVKLHLNDNPDHLIAELVSTDG